MAGGRPTKLTDEAREKTIAYLQERLKIGLPPTAAGLAVELDVNKSTLYEWAKKDEQFSDTLDHLNEIQESTLVDGSLSNKLNPTISKLMLANHGYRERQDITSNDKALPTPIIGLNDVSGNHGNKEG